MEGRSPPVSPGLELVVKAGGGGPCVAEVLVAEAFPFPLVAEDDPALEALVAVGLLLSVLG